MAHRGSRKTYRLSAAWGAVKVVEFSRKHTANAHDSLQEKLNQIGAKVLRHAKYVTFQMAVVPKVGAAELASRRAGRSARWTRTGAR